MLRVTEPAPVPPRRSRWRIFGVAILVLGAAAGGLIWLWDWNWIRPLVEARVSTAIGRKVTFDRLEVHPGRVTAVTVQGVKVANPAGFDGPDFATAPRLSFKFDAETWWRSGQVVLPMVELDQPNLNLVRNDAGQANWDFSGQSQKAVRIDDAEIKNGVAHLLDQPEQADMMLNIHAANGDTPAIDGTGTYAGQPITFHAVGGPLSSLHDATSPYQIDLEVTNGDTRITLKGHVRDPLTVGGADLALELSGRDMALLLPLTGIAIPPTPPYRISGQLKIDDGRFDFTNITGEVGSSDLNGELHLDPTGARPVLNGTLTSRKADLKDFGGFIGATPGHTAARAQASSKLLPAAKISVPKVLSADVHLTYRGDKIVGENLPFDTITITLDIASGHIRLAPLRIGVGSGAISGTVDLTPADDQMDADANMTISNLNIARLLATAGLGNGAGSIDGTAQLKGRGTSLASILAHGDGGFRVEMPMGGDINSRLIDLLGEEFGRAFFTSFEVSRNERIRCMLADFVLKQGVLVSRALEADTTDHIITGGGRIDLAREVMDITLRVDPKYFTILTVATPIRISGSFRNLHVGTEKDLEVHSGIGAGLGVLFPPGAVLPTIQFGVGDKSPCAGRTPR
jgi:AsmA family protein